MLRLVEGRGEGGRKGGGDGKVMRRGLIGVGAKGRRGAASAFGMREGEGEGDGNGPYIPTTLLHVGF